MTHAQYQILFAVEWIVWAGAVGFALWRGDIIVRLAGLLQFAATGGMAIAFKLGAPTALWAWVDAIGFVPLLLLALRRPRPWLIGSAAFQLTTVATHVARTLDERIETTAYVTALNTWWMLQLAALVWGTVEAMRRRTTDAEAAA
ncbi:hypothetical protein [Caulobacter sp. 17J80-11]|uniref:hypothetical protein n=1 Tax=Caulobacter sp. 17J80-11 TaxID=2763502 RepID=UPI001653CACA|nr:hypothetical protein [Caulobacter sp. 17J80-11]MBC6980167.1 hypothetical protein [Caulobacter sp. 17J80-11]